MTERAPREVEQQCGGHGLTEDDAEAARADHTRLDAADVRGQLCRRRARVRRPVPSPRFHEPSVATESAHVRCPGARVVYIGVVSGVRPW
ncbi:hypothetical protein GCM10025883_02070 [Mobilicoccus caccae]|uniref:Uncharacterized protein n=1 Tax=Mobilicoccus caccae TaxID=1859295 RepID=A0ABQ6ILU1_9MICO|nr:hypothetical protein GCM10025883_02070 [Mobilicoccus caccae]